MNALPDFIQSFELFLPAYFSGWLLAVLLSFAGVIIVARDQIFMSLSLGQVAALGVAALLFLGELFGHNLHELADALAFVLPAAAAIWLGQNRGGTALLSPETRSGFLFVFSASATLLLARYISHGMEEVQKLMISTLLTSGTLDIAIYAFLLLVLLVFAVLNFRPLFFTLLDEVAARARGLRTGALLSVSYALCGAAIGLGISKAGLIFTFSCLVLPAMTARLLSRSLFFFLLALPLVATLAIWPGFFLAHTFDHAPGQSIAFVLCLLFGLGLLLDLIRRRFKRPKE